MLRNCGGSGGCSGATVELAMAYTLKNGLATDPRQASQRRLPQKLFQHQLHHQIASEHLIDDGYFCHCSSSAKEALLSVLWLLKQSKTWTVVAANCALQSKQRNGVRSAQPSMGSNASACELMLQSSEFDHGKVLSP